MLQYAVVFFIIALVAAFFGFGGKFIPTTRSRHGIPIWRAGGA